MIWAEPTNTDAYFPPQADDLFFPPGMVEKLWTK